MTMSTITFDDDEGTTMWVTERTGKPIEINVTFMQEGATIQLTQTQEDALRILLNLRKERRV